MTVPNDDTYGWMRSHIATRRAHIACSKHRRDELHTHAQECGLKFRRSVLKHDLAWLMAQHGLIDADGNLRDGFPS